MQNSRYRDLVRNIFSHAYHASYDCFALDFELVPSQGVTTTMSLSSVELPSYAPPLFGDENGLYRVHIVGNSGTI